ncbi:MAG: TRAP transporter large permease subunit, partial [Ferrovibrionaceae bacterium]
MILAIGLLVLFALLAIGTPVGFAMAGAGALGLWLIGGPSVVLGVFQTAPFSGVSSYELITIPMFLLMAELVLLSGVVDGLFRAAAAWVGGVRGGLGMAT